MKDNERVVEEGKMKAKKAVWKIESVAEGEWKGTELEERRRSGKLKT